MSGQVALFDIPGPVMRRRIWIWSIVTAVAVVAVLIWVVLQLVEKGQFAPKKWLPFVEEEGFAEFMLGGLGLTLGAAAVGIVLALILGILLAVLRMSQLRAVRIVTTVFVEIFRGAPVLLVMLFFFLAFPAIFKVSLPAFWTVVFALFLFNGAVICEIVRAGVAALPSGQTEAAKALGMSNLKLIRLILLPQALRVMLPTLISQYIVLLKDTSLGFIIGYTELLQRGQSASLLFNNPLQTFALIAIVYILLNSGVSRLSHWISDRQQSRPGRTPKIDKLRPVTTAITLGVRPPRTVD